jgi:hypothetical protein
MTDEPLRIRSPLHNCRMEGIAEQACSGGGAHDLHGPQPHIVWLCECIERRHSDRLNGDEGDGERRRAQRQHHESENCRRDLHRICALMVDRAAWNEHQHYRHNTGSQSDSDQLERDISLPFLRARHKWQ